MLIIGELINGMFKDVAKAIQNREADIIQHLAEDQVAAGARALDVNVGPYSKDPKADMKWLVDTIRKVTDATLSLDSSKADVVEVALAAAKSRAIINSTNADEDRMKTVFALAKKYKAQVIGLAMDKTGVPGSADKRVELAASIVARAMDSGISPEDLFIDPIVMPLNVAQAQGREVLESIKQFSQLCTPAPNTVIGLSNVSQATKTRSIINRTFLVMAMANGLTAAILDPLDKKLMDAMITAELILNKNIYCDSFLEAYRKK
jgi:5-methyltetrahydrofolate corrinoid/iron sulfur protein methyltransferase